MQAEITDILKKHTAANKRQTKSEIRVVEAKLAALNRNHKLLGAKPVGLKLEQKYQRTLYELQHPEVLREPFETGSPTGNYGDYGPYIP